MKFKNQAIIKKLLLIDCKHKEDVADQEEEEPEHVHEVAGFLLHDITGASTQQIMRVLGKIKGRSLLVLRTP